MYESYFKIIWVMKLCDYFRKIANVDVETEPFIDMSMRSLATARSRPLGKFCPTDHLSPRADRLVTNGVRHIHETDGVSARRQPGLLTYFREGSVGLNVLSMYVHFS